MPDEYKVNSVWIVKHQNKNLFKLCIEGDVDTSHSIKELYPYNNVYLNLTMEQLEKLQKEIKIRIRKYKGNEQVSKR